MKIVLHIDMNSYFATVEQQANPFWRGKPVGVCAYLSANGCIIASSIEAKKLGIKTGCLVKEAKKIYPQIILVENQPDKYRWVTSQIFTILRHYSDQVEPYSIDEAFVDLTGYTDSFLVAQKIALQIQRRVKEEVGEWLKCSIGIAYTRYLAKLASDLAGVDSLKIITPEALDQALDGLELTDAWGINKRLAKRLQGLGIHNLLELKNYPPANLLTVMGKPGYYLWANLNGQELEKVDPGKPQQLKSVGHSYCLPKKEPNLRYFSQVYMKLCEKTGRRLRALNKEAHSIMVSWAYDAGGGYYKLQKVFPPLFDSWDIFHKTWGIFTAYYSNEPVRFLAVSVTSLLPLSGQLELFNKDEKIKQRELVKAMDEVNNRYGEYAVIRGAMFGAEDNARDRIGFRKTISTEFVADKSITYDTAQPI